MKSPIILFFLALILIGHIEAKIKPTAEG